MLAELENLFALQDKNYREFHARLMPNIEKDRIIGIRVPVLRKYAKELASGSRLFLSVQNEKENDCDNVEKFLNSLPHYYYEENNLHMFLIMSKTVYGMGLNIDQLFTVNLNLSYNLPHWQIGLEYSPATAWYGTIDQKKRVKAEYLLRWLECN